MEKNTNLRTPFCEGYDCLLEHIKARPPRVLLLCGLTDVIYNTPGNAETERAEGEIKILLQEKTYGTCLAAYITSLRVVFSFASRSSTIT